MSPPVGVPVSPFYTNPLHRQFCCCHVRYTRSPYAALHSHLRLQWGRIRHTCMLQPAILVWMEFGNQNAQHTCWVRDAELGSKSLIIWNRCSVLHDSYSVETLLLTARVSEHLCLLMCLKEVLFDCTISWEKKTLIKGDCFMSLNWYAMHHLQTKHAISMGASCGHDLWWLEQYMYIDSKDMALTQWAAVSTRSHIHFY